MFCTQCGSNVPQDQKFCTNCGEKTDSPTSTRRPTPQQIPESSRQTAPVAAPAPTPLETRTAATPTQIAATQTAARPSLEATVQPRAVAGQAPQHLEPPQSPAQELPSIKPATPPVPQLTRTATIQAPPTKSIARKGMNPIIAAVCAIILVLSAGAYFGVRKYSRSAMAPQLSSPPSPSPPPMSAAPATESQSPVAENQSPTAPNGAANPTSPVSGELPNGKSQPLPTKSQPPLSPNTAQPGAAITSVTKTPPSKESGSVGEISGTKSQAPQKWGFNNPPSPSNSANPPATQPTNASTPPPPPSTTATPAPPSPPESVTSTSVPLAATAAPSPQPISTQIPTATILAIQTIDPIDSSTNRTGDQFHASLAEPIVVGTQVIIPKGADARLRLTEAKSAGHFTGKSELQIELVAIDCQGKSFPVVSEPYEAAGSSRGKSTAKKVGIGAVAGAVVGGILGGGSGAVIGASAGAGGGTVVQALTKGKRVRIPSETRIEFRLQQPVIISYVPANSSK